MSEEIKVLKEWVDKAKEINWNPRFYKVAEELIHDNERRISLLEKDK